MGISHIFSSFFAKSFVIDSEVAKFDIVPGTSISDTAKAALEYLEMNKKVRAVQFDFNQINVEVTRSLTVKDVCDFYSREVRRSYDEYCNTQEYLERKKEREEVAKLSQMKIDALMKSLPDVVKDEPQLILWMEKYCSLADNTCVNTYLDDVLFQLLKAGYAINDAVGLPKEEYADLHTSARYILGQIMDFLNRGNPPHQVAISFIQAYKLSAFQRPCLLCEQDVEHSNCASE